MDELSVFRNRRVLVTGHTGFKGSWLSIWLRELGADVIGYSLGLPSSPGLFEALGLDSSLRHHDGDVREGDALQQLFDKERPEIVFHLAAQALVRQGHRQPKTTFDTNVGGTVNVLEAARQTASVRAVIVVTSDKCYETPPPFGGYRETDRLGGADPYSASKACAEWVAAAYREGFLTTNRGLATARAGNVIGGGDWASDRVVPDCIRALTSGKRLLVRNPHAVRPWQHVLEPLAGYLALAARLWHDPTEYDGAWNFGPAPDGERTVADLVEAVFRTWGWGRLWINGRRAERWPPPREAGVIEADCLRLCSDKARQFLPWRPQWNFDAAVERAVKWYRAYFHRHGRDELMALCRKQISDYQRAWQQSAEPIPQALCA